MYHSISTNEEQGKHPYFRLNTSPEIFDKHMQFLDENKYTVISLNDLEIKIKRKNAINENYAMITFDDGLKNFYTYAFPILTKYNFTATMFLPTAFINSNGTEQTNYLNWYEVKEMQKHGISFGSHTISHPTLVALDQKRVETEIKDSKKEIEDKTGMSVFTFSYPFKFPEENKNFKLFLRETLINSGYTHGVTTIIGTASYHDDIFFLKRLPVNSCDDMSFFKAKLNGHYNWLHSPQLLLKRMRYYF
jgi:peptidoglycan/xylan/chitin deacetylase (PgdA/CDA1 family)